ncbi:MAG: metal-dependent transcriptional regulator [Saprospiraceae bacterium]|jgi:DtxR family Mn-dependent transcriptional regulator|nr:metal-dependent transcriptional regulator [Saprospiraceae bacterium]
MAFTLAEEDYLKAIYKGSEKYGNPVSTSAIAEIMQTRAASVTDMLKKLAEKDLIHYERYRGVSLTKEGAKTATMLIRKHRLWEVFLVDKLGFTWDEVHDIAEQLEHIQSDALVDRLDHFLGTPRFDPHGDPIPDASGAYRMRPQILLNELPLAQSAVIVGVKEHTSAFLKYLDQMGLTLGVHLHVEEVFPYDGSLKLILQDGSSRLVSGKAAPFIYVQLNPSGNSI